MGGKRETRRAGVRGRASGSPSRAAGLTENITQTPADVIAETPRNGRASHMESAEGYASVLARLNAGFRVIRCKDGLQWIIQRRDGWAAGAPRWAGFRYHLTRDPMLAACRALCGPCDPAALASLALLPELIGRAAG